MGVNVDDLYKKYIRPRFEAPTETPNNLDRFKDSQLNNVVSLINVSPQITDSKITLLLFERSKFVINEHIPNAPKRYFGMSEFDLDCFDSVFNCEQTTSAPATEAEEQVINEFPKYDFTNWKPFTITVDSITGKGIRNY
jgi:hypothetical protein